MSRISRQQLFMRMAHLVSERSTCFRLNVGAIIVKNNRLPISIGYNGRASGEPHCQGNECPGKYQCRETIHAERNAIEMIDPFEDRSVLDLYCTDSPCEACAWMMREWSIKRLFFDRKYRDEGPLEWLITKKIEVYRVTPAGYVIRYPDGEIVEV